MNKIAIVTGGAGNIGQAVVERLAMDPYLIVVLDVNEDYRPWLVERERLFSAMDTLDGDNKRGLLLIE